MERISGESWCFSRINLGYERRCSEGPTKRNPHLSSLEDGMLKKAALSAAIGGMAGFAIGCAITDYDGWSGHQTSSEAKLWGSEGAFSGFGGGYDGEEFYNVKDAAGAPRTIKRYQQTRFRPI